MIITTVIAFIVIFSILILVHEWGHFTAARKSGIKVEEFGLGMPPMAKKVYTDKKGTIYTLNWIPFGGFVRLFGEDSSDPKVLKDKRSFASKTIPQRALVICAGVIMNFLLAWFLISIGFTIGMKPFLVSKEDVNKAIEQGIASTTPVLYVHSISEEGALSKTDLKVGDYIKSVNGIVVDENFDISKIVQADSDVELSYIRDNKENKITAHSNQDAKLGMSISQEDMLSNIKNIRYPFYLAPIKSAQEIGRLSILTVKMMGDVVVSIVAKFTVPNEVAGPIGIAKMTHRFVQEGFMALLQFTALLSISLGVINIMPFPALDGGRLLFIIFELISRKKPNAKAEAIIHSIGFVLLMILILVVTWNDILNLFA